MWFIFFVVLMQADSLLLAVSLLFAFMHIRQTFDFLIYLPRAILLAAAYLKSNRSLVFARGLSI